MGCYSTPEDAATSTSLTDQNWSDSEWESVRERKE